MVSPLELFFPIPSLSTTSSLHRMWRAEDSLGVGVSVSVSAAPRNRRVWGSRNLVVEDSRDVSVVDWSWGVVPGWCDRDILLCGLEGGEMWDDALRQKLLESWMMLLISLTALVTCSGPNYCNVSN